MTMSYYYEWMRANEIISQGVKEVANAVIRGMGDPNAEIPNIEARLNAEGYWIDHERTEAAHAGTTVYVLGKRGRVFTIPAKIS